MQRKNVNVETISSIQFEFLNYFDITANNQPNGLMRENT